MPKEVPKRRALLAQDLFLETILEDRTSLELGTTVRNSSSAISEEQTKNKKRLCKQVSDEVNQTAG